ncbi:MAG: prepilin-type N-terminal cleavage/methylation domain-containing protein [Rhodoferax sp.]|nr:prepilin-type N-terminal cleavage/methylation domain-containing protein [Rhodoferax sp.]
MPTSAIGRPASGGLRRRAPRGFTLLELMIVVAIVAMASATVVLALRDSAQSQLDREALRLLAQLETLRAESRATGVPLLWRAKDQGYEVSDGVTTRSVRWNIADLQAQADTSVPLGPEPIIGPHSVRLWMRDAPERSLWINTDGLRSFEVSNVAPTGSAR